MESQKIVEKFYSSFQLRDAENMVSCYHPEAAFEDPVFGKLQSDDIKNMWRMLVMRGKDLNIQFAILNATENAASVTWLATYTFSLTGKRIKNHIHAEFKIKDGLIIEHTDSFNLAKWLLQAFGFKGLLIAYIPMLKNKFLKGVKKSLKQFKASHPAV